MKTAPYFAFMFLFITYTVIDIKASELFSPFGIPEFSNTYFIVWELIALIFAVLLGLAFKSYALGLSFIFLARNGTEDWLYYFLQAQSPPSTLPWLKTWLPSYEVATPFSLNLAVVYGLIGMLLLIQIEARIRRSYMVIAPKLKKALIHEC